MDRSAAFPSWPQRAVRAAVAMLFLASGASKLWDPQAFAQAVENYRLLPSLGVYLSALSVPWLELVAGAALFLPRFRAAAWLLIVMLSAGFTVFSVSAWWRGLDIACGCFGSGAARTGFPAALRAAALVVTTGLAFLLECRSASAKTRPAGESVVRD